MFQNDLPYWCQFPSKIENKKLCMFSEPRIFSTPLYKTSSSEVKANFPSTKSRLATKTANNAEYLACEGPPGTNHLEPSNIVEARPQMQLVHKLKFIWQIH